MINGRNNNAKILYTFIILILILYSKIAFSQERNDLIIEFEKNEIGGERRTLNWMDKILTEIKSAPTLVAVGINHFIGENGLIHLLRQHGYTVEPVK